MLKIASASATATATASATSSATVTSAVDAAAASAGTMKKISFGLLAAGGGPSLPIRWFYC